MISNSLSASEVTPLDQCVFVCVCAGGGAVPLGSQEDADDGGIIAELCTG